MIEDVEAFRAAWNAAQAIEAGPRPDAAIQKALDRLAEGVLSRVVRGSTVQAALKPYLAAVKRGESTSDAGSLDATVYRDGDRWILNARMGYASSLSAFNSKGERLSLPNDLRWSYRYFGSILKTGTYLAFDGISLSDAGIRYDYRFQWLRRTMSGYVSAGLATGTWTFGDSEMGHLEASGNRVKLRSLDSPKTFFFANAVRALRRTETWSLSWTGARRTSVAFYDADLRAADLWLQTHRGTKLGDWIVAKDNRMVSSIHRGRDLVELDLDGIRLHFNLIRQGGKLVVRGVTVKP
ncbi:hypothetical protein EON82_02520 [bacterium]|nr:MAG: hypothetical protein EON82_02520 [bacterium]